MMRMNAGEEGKVDSTDYGLFQINDKVWNTKSLDLYGKKPENLTAQENIKMASWISKNSPRKVGNTTSGWNNWSAYLNNSYKQHLNKSDQYYLSGGMTSGNLKLIEREFGEDAGIAKAVMYAESAGNHSAINDNLKGGGARTGKKAGSALPGKGVPFQAGSEWNNSAISYMANQLGIATPELKSKYGKFLESNFLNKFMNEDGSSKLKGVSLDKANNYLKNFTEELKDYSKTNASIKLTVPSGKHQGKKMNKSIVNDLLKQKRIDFAKTRGGAARGYEWLDSFANQLGFSTAEELNSKEGAKAMKDYYSGVMQSAPQDSLDFSQPFNMNIIR